jgi:hypothetical protein
MVPANNLASGNLKSSFFGDANPPVNELNLGNINLGGPNRSAITTS